MANVVYTLELTAYNVGGGAPVTLYYADGNGFVTSSTDTPASTFFDGRLLQPSAMKRDMFTAGATSGRSRIDFGSVELNNADGGLDALLTYGYGLDAVVREGTVGAAYPASFTIVFAGTAQQPTAAGENLSLSLRSLQADLEQPFQPTKYAGNNSLPAGLEGVAGDLKGKPKPVALGTVLNVSAPQVNTSKLIYQVSDGAVQSVDAVYDAGLNLEQGLIWAKSAHGLGAGTYRASAFGGGTYVIGGNAGVAASSANGTTWTSRTSQFGADNIRAMAYGASIFVAVGEAGKASSSPDGQTWTSRTSGFGATNIIDVTFGGGLFVAVGSSGKVSTSSDGQTWTAQTPITGSPNLVCVSYGDGLYVAATGTAGGQIYTSPDGATWTARLTTFPVYGFIQFAYGNNMWVGLGTDSTGLTALLVTSIDGVTWIKSPSVFVAGVFPLAIAFGAGSFVAIVSDFKMATSTTGADWTLRDSVFASTSTSSTSIIFDGTNYFAPGSDTYTALATLIAYANTTELADETLAPASGQYIACPSAGYIRLGSPPAGQVTCDVSQGANAAARTAGQLFAAVMARAGISAGTTSGTYLAADVTALDTANSAVLGDWISEETTYADVLDRIANSVGAWWGLDRQGRYRIQQFTAPAGTAVATITANDLYQPLQRVALQGDDSKGIPTWRSILRYQKNYTVQTSGLAGAVTDARRSFLAKEWREAINQDTVVQAAHALAVETSYETLMASATAAATEASRLQTLRGTLRHAYDAVVTLSQYPTVDLGDVVTLQHSRYGLSAGVLHRVIGVETNARLDRVTFRLWGPPDATSLLRAPAPVLAGTGTTT